ncbi:MAG: putative HicB family RNase H-like nuclease [Pseudoalteromonas rhizosphaerae]|jgi:predicted HicB family RNase H-like nuclease|uniref:type II toxin-antitoxin system HicB family antitoxin n=1 Tax=Pseudoalteromonas rhizosphaerae TaxID=2518973 RepID=UPI0039E6FD17
MSKCLKYKGFLGSVETCLEENVVYGKIECINDLITYEATNLAELRKEFESSVDDYLETCELLGKQPDKTMSGTFNVRVGNELHKKVFLKARENGKSLNEYICELLERGIGEIQQVHVIHKNMKSTPITRDFDMAFDIANTWDMNTKSTFINHTFEEH